MIVTNNDKQVFCLQGLPEEVIAVLFAYYSRSDKGLREILQADPEFKDFQGAFGAKNLEAKAAAFHRKWVVGYGHSSVSEHAILHYGIEECSILASKAIEDNRLASYTEKSTRYCKMGKYYTPTEFIENQEYLALMELAFETYRKVYDAVTKYYSENIDTSGDPKLVKNKIHAGACDVARYCLPLSNCTNIGLTCNARVASRMIGKLLGSECDEFKVIGGLLREEGRKICPTLLEEVPSIFKLSGELQQDNHRRGGRVFADTYDQDYIIRKLAALRMYSKNQHTLDDCLELVNLVSAQSLKGQLLPIDRCWEGVDITVEMTLDYGAFRDIQRHRMCSQFVKALTPYKGYMIHEMMVTTDTVGAYEELCARCAEFYEKNKEGGSYGLLLGFNLSFLVKMNLREVAHFISLRSKKQGHISYRSEAWKLHDWLTENWPDIGALIPCDRERVVLARRGTETIERKEQ